MMKKPKKPKMSFNSLKSIKENHWHYRVNKSEDEYPCIECHTTGYIKNRMEYCSNEGLKYADTIKCPSCNGSGSMTRSDYIKIYQEAKAFYKEELERYTREMNLYNSIVNKLSKEEIEYIKKRLVFFWQ